MCYHFKFGSAASKGVRINRSESPKIFEERWGPVPWDGRHGSNQETRPSPHMLPCGTWAFCVKGYSHRKPLKLGSAGPHPLGVWVWLTPENKLPHMCYHVKFGSEATKGVGLLINRRKPQKIFGKRCTPSHMCYHVKFSGSASNDVCINRTPKKGERSRQCATEMS